MLSALLLLLILWSWLEILILQLQILVVLMINSVTLHHISRIERRVIAPDLGLRLMGVVLISSLVESRLGEAASIVAGGHCLIMLTCAVLVERLVVQSKLTRMVHESG
jgi:hypothetical protein